MSSRLANSLRRLRAELGERWPHLSTHFAVQPEVGGHHSDRIADKVGVCVYRSMDFSNEYPGLLIAEQIAMLGRRGHPSLQSGSYILSNRRIAAPQTSWEWRDYLGAAYLTHVHITVSVSQEGYDSEQPWSLLDATVPAESVPAEIPFGDTPDEIRDIQRRLNRIFPNRSPLVDTGNWDSDTTGRLSCFQKRSMLVASGMLDARTLEAIMR